jgi:hypothetical protein
VRHGKGRGNIKEPKQNRLEPKAEVVKNRMFRFMIPDSPIFSE